jgi:glycosyltransferase involved in cell wall biosynthesis
MSILVITPTTGAPELADAMRSVQFQTYKNIEHLIVVDGTKFSSNVDRVYNNVEFITDEKIKRIDLPFNTGGGGFYGHRIMAGFGHLINHDYVIFLDQDNWFEKDHVETLINKIESSNLDWAYSLRQIFDKDKTFITVDNCESLGRWPAWVGPDVHLIDTSSYCFKTSFYRQVCHIWDYGWGGDRRFYTILKNHIKHDNYACTGKYTLNYRLGGNDGSVQASFFIDGNKHQEGIYPGCHPRSFPWNL